MIVRELLTRIGFQVGPDWKQIPRDIDNVKKKADDAANAFRGIFAGFIGFSALKSLIHTADEMQQLQARIGQLPQTIGLASDAFDEVAKHANATGSSLAAYATLYTRIGQAARDVIPDQKELLSVIDTISKAVATGGASATEQKSAFYQLSQAFNVGKLQGNDLHALRTAAPDFVRAIGDALGYTGEQFAEAAKDGKVTTNELVKAIDKIKSAFDARFSKLPFTFARAFTIMENRYGMFINKINNESSVVPRISKFFADFFDGVFDGLNELVDALGGGGQALKIFAAAALAALGPSAIKILVGGLRLLASETFILFAALFAVILIGQDFYTWLNGGDSIIGRWAGVVRKSNGELDKMRIAIVAVGVALAAFILLAPAATFRALGLWVPYLTIRLGELIAALWAGNLAALGFTWPLWGVVAAILAVVAAGVLLYKYLNGDFDQILKGSGNKFVEFAQKFLQAVDWMINKWAEFKNIFHMPDLTVAGSLVPGLGAAQNIYHSLNPPPGNAAPVNNVTINQTLPPGSTPEVADASYSASRLAVEDFFGLSHVTRQMNQVSQ
jgi:tape measure domain-containing protein